jgi:2'-5' RNA ligase
MRTFVAVFPPPEIREALASAARDLPVLGKVRFTDPANLHLTLKFLGDIPQDDLDRVVQVLEPIRERHEPFEAAISAFGAFPSPRRARILWAGIGEGADRLRALAQDVERSLEPLCPVREDRVYVPHLTVGRARGRPVTLQATKTSPPVPAFSVSNVELMKSVLGKSGAVYSTLVTYPLSESRD